MRKKKPESNLLRSITIDNVIFNISTHVIFDTTDRQFPNTRINKGMSVYLAEPTLQQLAYWIRNTNQGILYGWCIANQETCVIRLAGKLFKISQIADSGRSVLVSRKMEHTSINNLNINYIISAWLPLESIVTIPQYYKLTKDINKNVNTMFNEERNIVLT